MSACDPGRLGGACSRIKLGRGQGAKGPTLVAPRIMRRGWTLAPGSPAPFPGSANHAGKPTHLQEVADRRLLTSGRYRRPGYRRYAGLNCLPGGSVFMPFNMATIPPTMHPRLARVDADPAPSQAFPAQRERQILDLLYRMAPGNRSRSPGVAMDPPLTNATIRPILRALEVKGYNMWSTAIVMYTPRQSPIATAAARKGFSDRITVPTSSAALRCRPPSRTCSTAMPERMSDQEFDQLARLIGRAAPAAQ